ncbi:hypothetical protein ACHAXT_011740 [Thalassiosira profunda]
MAVSAQEQQQAQQANRGILPSETLNALDCLVDRLNAASGRIPSTAATPLKNGEGAPSPSPEDDAPLPIRALLVGTNEGVGLSRSLGTAHAASQLRSAATNDPNFSHSGTMSEEVLSGVETVWATLVSAAPPHIMAASAAGAASAAANNDAIREEKKEDAPPVHVQPPHPLLSPLQMGDHIRTVTATYENCTLVHVHMAPLVVTFVTLPEANIGAIRSIALPLLKVLLEPVRRALVRSRGAAAVDGNAAGVPGQAVQQVGGNGQQMSMEQRVQQQAMAQAQAQALGFMQPQMQAMQQGYPGQNVQMDPALQQQLYQQQLYQQQMMMAQQQQQQGYQQP